MSHSFDEISQQLKRRHRKSARLKWISMGALGLAGLFLVLFFADMLSKGLPEPSITQLKDRSAAQTIVVQRWKL